MAGFTIFEFATTLWFDWNSAIFENVTTGNKLSQAFSQALSTRHAGFAVMDLSLLSAAGMPSLTPASATAIGLMYASAVPVSNAVLNSGGAELVKSTHKNSISIRKSLVDVVTNHLVGLFIFFVLIAYFENEHLETDEAFTEYKILFELIRSLHSHLQCLRKCRRQSWLPRRAVLFLWQVHSHFQVHPLPGDADGSEPLPAPGHQQRHSPRHSRRWLGLSGARRDRG